MADRKRSYKQGMWAERLAALYLMLKGYRVLERRYKTKVGEVDLIARKRDTLLFVEVKVRKRIDEALSAVTTKAQTRIQRAAGHYLFSHPDCADCTMRFDLIAMAPPLKLQHLDNAWQIQP